ncbi:DUF4177 domain-containing protein [Longimicrobium terrae]|uniref:DUF4177 domain-containing protein n=1 Tax=Longimicrobium terrae TaxID=1639882 RepID=A0A841GVD5_9BACT|nr:DUF4177 domain-containing protein [Longimicrobium terrae]MBB4634375.1 hypothetical protein [Longimicrobium terrae]MBB6068735.1 hypothetical protein [Longimicrobium terrae]NNC27921.1 DUF4177 domain-containing protein [Longimicrobium terrae]
MKTWEYYVLTPDEVERSGFFQTVSPKAVEARLNELGSTGWELVNIDFLDSTADLHFRAVLKRERPA